MSRSKTKPGYDEWKYPTSSKVPPSSLLSFSKADLLASSCSSTSVMCCSKLDVLSNREYSAHILSLRVAADFGIGSPSRNDFVGLTPTRSVIWSGSKEPSTQKYA